MTAFPGVQTLSSADAREKIDKLAHKSFSTNGADLLARYRACVYQGEDSRRVADLEMLLPFVT